MVMQNLAPYASKPDQSGGRLYPERDCTSRNPWARDRDRIVHSTAFRRLNYKTQVFVYHEGDHYRSRLTHSLEVSQIARAMARRLGLHEDLTEALALAHDLGHPPFGHAGERALDRAMADHGGFDHNIQTLRAVIGLERLYADYDGLNLTVEVIEGLAKHNGPLTGDDMSQLPDMVVEIGEGHDVAWGQHGSGEAQIAAIADDIAYSAHDLDDGLRAGLISKAALSETKRTSAYKSSIEARYEGLEDGRFNYELKRRLITDLVEDAVNLSRIRLDGLGAKDVAEIKAASSPVVQFSPDMWTELKELRSFLFGRVYRHKAIVAMTDGAEVIVGDLFRHYLDQHDALPQTWAARVGDAAVGERGRVIGDFVAGMTDRFAIAEHERLFDATPELR